MRNRVIQPGSNRVSSTETAVAACIAAAMLVMASPLASQEMAHLMLVNLGDAARTDVLALSESAEAPSTDFLQQGNYQAYPPGNYEISSVSRSGRLASTSVSLEGGLKYTAVYGPGDNGQSRWHVLADHNLTVESFSVQWAHFAPAVEAQNAVLAMVCDDTVVQRSAGLNIGDGTTNAGALDSLVRETPQDASVCWFIAENPAGDPIAQSVRIPTRLGLRLRMFLVGEIAEELELFTTIQALPPTDTVVEILSVPEGFMVQEMAGESVYLSRAGNALNGFVFDFDDEGLPRWSAFASEKSRQDVPVIAVSSGTAAGSISTETSGVLELSPHPCGATLRSSSVLSARTRSHSPVQHGNRLQAVACGGRLTP